MTKRKSSTRIHLRRTAGAPSFDEALDALLQGKPKLAAARFAQRVLVNPRDDISRSNHAVALYDAGRWADAARAFEHQIAREGIESEVASPTGRRRRACEQ